MRIVLSIVALLALVSVSVPTSAAILHPTDSTAVLVDSFVVSVEVPPSAYARTGIDFDLSDDGTLNIEETICVWATTNGIDLIGDVTTIRANMPAIDFTTAAEIVSALSHASVDSAIAIGYYGTIDSSGTTTTVFHARCVERVGTGSETSFVPSPLDLAGRIYSIVGTSNPVVTDMGSVFCEFSCGYGTERTCD